MSKTIRTGAGHILWTTVWYFRWAIVAVIFALALGLFTGYQLNDKEVPEPKVIIKEAYGPTIETYLELQLEETKEELALITREAADYKIWYETSNDMRDNLEATLTQKSLEDYQVVEFELTAYCACPLCCGEWSDGFTATGTKATAGRTIAVDPKVIPLGSTVYIDGLGLFIAEDTGSAINGNIIDIYFDDHEEALKFGRQTRKAIVIKLGGDE